jgi:Zn-dependent protease with chaperone function/tetratricopeptide (TPR) repeat protein
MPAAPRNYLDSDGRQIASCRRKQMTPDASPVERPLTGRAKLSLLLGAAGVMFSCYIFSTLALLGILLLIALQLALVLVLLRFGMAGLMILSVQKQANLVGLFFRACRVQKGVDAGIALLPPDAPGLYQVITRLCGQLGLQQPQDIALEMSANAHVKLHGLRQGAGKVSLAIGYDLLAGLTVAEMDAVLAHEMAHAKLIQRGLRNWLNAGQARMAVLAMGLRAEIDTWERAKSPSAAAQFMFRIVDPLVRLNARFVAAYSRQNEFEADHGAADLCGAAAARSALLRVNALSRASARLPWNQRVAVLQETGGYSEWLQREIVQGAEGAHGDDDQVLLNKYSTHPNLRDRLAALPEDGRTMPAVSPPAIQLLAHPDEVALNLVTKLQQAIAEQEAKDSRLLAQFSRKFAGRTSLHLRPVQFLPVALIALGCILLLGALVGHAGLFCLLGLLLLVLGVVGYRKAAYRDLNPLPVPAYTSLTHSPSQNIGSIQNKQQEIESELRERIRGKKVPKPAGVLAGEAFAALGQCDYLRAHAAARMCLAFDKKSIHGALAMAVACAAHHQFADASRLMTFVQSRTGFKTFSTVWGWSWVALMAGDWPQAEAFLQTALKLQPNDTTLLALLAIAQFRRGKLQSAIANARRVCQAEPGSLEHARFLVARLLDGGFTAEAQSRMEQLKPQLPMDPELMLCMAQLCLLRRLYAEADEWTTRLKDVGAPAQLRIRLAQINEFARRPEHANQLYLDALTNDHYPEAQLGLARLDFEKKNSEEARRHLIAALNMEKPPGKDGVAVLMILQLILRQFLLLHPQVPSCKAWIAKAPLQSQLGPVQNRTFLVYAPDLKEAQDHFGAILNAFLPGKSPWHPSQTSWEAAPRVLQPDGPVRPGVQCLWTK